MKKVYFFDFDGTLTYKDTMFLFLKYYHPAVYWRQFIWHIPLFVLLKLKLIDAEKVKQKFVYSILKGATKEELTTKATHFFEKYYPNLIRPKALKFIEEINKEGARAYLVTASLDIWTKPFADKFGFGLIATKTKFVEGKIVKEFDSKNCNGQEKVNRILSEIGENDTYTTIAFGDTNGDREMLSWASEGYFRYFH